MSANEIVTLVATGVAILASLAAIVQSRRKPQVDEANIDQIKASVRRDNAEYNMQRDAHIVRLEKWAFEKVRPWGREVVQRYDEQQDQLRELASAMGRDIPAVRLPPFPDMPEPLPFPK